MPYRATRLGAVGELNDILEGLESSLGPLGGEPVPLDGGITNRNYRVTLGGSEFVLRRPGRDTDLLGIDRESERLANDAAASLGIAPAVAGGFGDCLLTRFIACTAMGADEVADEAQEIALALRRFHDSPVRLPRRFRVPDLLADYAAIVRDRGSELPAAYAEAVRCAARIDAILALQDPRPCHNDLLAGNIIRAREDGRMMIVDWEYAGMGDPRFDLGNLSINNGFDEADDERLLGAYHGGTPTDRQRAELQLTRVLSDAREAAWGVVQAAVSELDFDFAGYAREHFKRLQAAVERPDFEACLAAAGA